MPTKEELGRRLKAVRQSRGLTLKEVEMRSGVSMTHTSQIERGLTSPTIGALEKLARALDKTLPYFVEESELADVSVVRKDNRNSIRQDRGGLLVESLSSGIPGGTVQFYYLTLPAGAKETKRREHDGEECAIVIKGSLEVLVGDETYQLKPGESIHFKASSPHAIRNSGRTTAEAVWASDQNPQF